ncbi:hypothetical protein CDL12_15220 [Handroanthus impetiginosus]|uniref:Factor of DNA methylation 1-5/IDN2 domain-containing protein n=1 Tax=Handroanthus impetiginosus TaxID=429701 RepID=A0A2G9H3T1_9LAMI|nr:hypothetical protein CDL12_15220 [Handroanthus impetiginosus]
MARCNYPKMFEDQKRLIQSLEEEIKHKNKMIMEMEQKLEQKDNLLEAALKQMQENSMQLKGKLRDLEIEIEELKAENQTLMVKERICNDELQAARKEAIKELQTMLTHHRTLFGIRKMGEINRKPFEETCLKKSCEKDWREESAKLCSLWEENVKNPHWHPFKRIKINGSLQEAIDEEDAKLKQLRNEGSEKVYEAVVNALLELNEYNPSGRFPVLELWNNKEKRKASLKEIVEYIIKQLKVIKTKSKRAFPV